MSILVSIFLWKVSKYKHLSCWSKGSTLVFYCDFPDQLFCRAPTSFIKLPRDNSCSEEFQLGGLGFLSNNGSFGGSWFAVGNISYISTSSHQWFSHPHYNHCLLMLVLFLHSLHSLHSLYFVTQKYGVVPYWITVLQMKNLRRYSFQIEAATRSVLEKSYKSCKIHRKTPVSESIFY